jgi:hypothetical protein
MSKTLTLVQKRYLKEKVLKYVNELRKKAGFTTLRHMPKALKEGHISATCPMALAIKGKAFNIKGYVNCPPDPFIPDDNIKPILWPNYVIKFIRAFDLGEFPELKR